MMGDEKSYLKQAKDQTQRITTTIASTRRATSNVAAKSIKFPSFPTPNWSRMWPGYRKATSLMVLLGCSGRVGQLLYQGENPLQKLHEMRNDFASRTLQGNLQAIKEESSLAVKESELAKSLAQLKEQHA